MSQTVAQLGEFALIDALQATLPASVRASHQVPLGIGDDASIWQPTNGMRAVITTDTLVEGVHFRTDWTDWPSLGFKSIAVNLSDIASMGARPTLVVVTLMLTGRELVNDLLALYRGMAELAGPHGVIIAGGDIVRTAGPLTISITAVGEGPHLLTRDTARPDDIVAVSGTLGASGAGLRLLQDPALHPTAATRAQLIRAHLRPQPRLALGMTLAAHGAHACMDLSDGLLGDLPKIMRASGVGAELRLADLPTVSALRALFPDDWPELAMRAGEDYELLFTCPPAAWAGIVAAATEIGASVTAIGRVTAGPAVRLVRPDGSVQDVVAGAFDHLG